MDQGLKEAIKLFKWAAKNVPAYGDFLKKNGIHPSKIRKGSDFAKIPIVSKGNYLRIYPFNDLLPRGKMPPMISVSSGSSGVPFYWPRGEQQEEVGSVMHEPIFRDIFRIGKKKTLVIVCFSMGTWIAGSFTMASARRLAEKGYNISVITPGIEKEDALAALKNFAPNFEHVILAGYPPFIMDIINEATARAIPMNRFAFNLLFAGENFSEKWRDTIHEMTGIKDPLHGSVSVYGTADAGMLGHENPLTIFVRRKTLEDARFFKAFFGDIPFLPTVVQYHPERIYFETAGNEIIFTANSGIPLIRYNIKDVGKLISGDEVKDMLKEYGYYKLIAKDLKRWVAPLVVLGGRNDVAVTFYALNIYPENIRAGLEDSRISKNVTGKFVAFTKNTNKQRNQILWILIEMSKREIETSSLKELVKVCIFDHLIKLNTEYRKLYNSIGRKALPKIKLMSYGDPLFKIRGAKHRWVSR